MNEGLSPPLAAVSGSFKSACMIAHATSAWLRVNEPDIMATKAKQQTGFTFKADVISDTASDISIDLQLSERVIVKRVGDELHVNHVGENPLPENDARPVQLYAGGNLVSEWRS